MMRADITSRGTPPSVRKWGKAAVVVWVVLLAAATTVVSAQERTTGAAAHAQIAPFSLGKVFTFLFMTLGPFKIFGPFAAMTRGRDGAFKRRLAFEGIIISALAMLAAVTVGANTLDSWGISVGALQLAAGIVLFLIALKPVLEQYEPHKDQPEASGSAAAPAPTASALAFSPLAFPTIVTPWGIAVLIMLATLRRDNMLQILGVTAFVLVLDLLAMLVADRILKTPFVASALGIVGAVMGVLQIALAVQATVDALRMMGVVGAGGG
jgi:multiple antibiotic resistance protein